jgi:hypothetical protein
VNIGRNILRSPTAFDDVIEKLNGAIKAYTAATGDLELKLSVRIFKQGQDLQNNVFALSNQIDSRFDTIEPDIPTIAGIVLNVH